MYANHQTSNRYSRPMCIVAMIVRYDDKYDSENILHNPYDAFEDNSTTFRGQDIPVQGNTALFSGQISTQKNKKCYKLMLIKCYTRINCKTKQSSLFCLRRKRALPFSVQHPSSLTTLGWEPSCNMMWSSLSKSSCCSNVKFTKNRRKSKAIFKDKIEC